MNTNCLAGLACPKCGQADRFFISAYTTAEVTDDGVQECHDAEWETDSGISCPACHHYGTVEEFYTTPPREKA